MRHAPLSATGRHPVAMWWPPGRDAILAGMDISLPSDPNSIARFLDREADVELQHGHHARAEMLARRAAELRGLA